MGFISDTFRGIPRQIYNYSGGSSSVTFREIVAKYIIDLKRIQYEKDKIEWNNHRHYIFTL